MIDASAAGDTLAGALKRRWPERSWSDVRRLCASGKISVDGAIATNPALRVRGGERVTLDMTAPRPAPRVEGFRIAFDDAHVVVIEKPSGVSSVPYERRETGTAMDLVRAAWRRGGKRATATPLYVVHRIDKDTSGLLCFAKTRLGERALHLVFQRHAATRAYLAVAEGDVAAARIESRIAPDRGDGIRGSTRHAGQGQHAVTNVAPIARLRGATLCRVQLETGRTHQIRIHLSERGHPLVGETVYIRDWRRAGRTPLPAPRLMLHAGLLGFPHPVTEEAIALRADPPPDFLAVVASLGGRDADCRL